MLFAIYQIRLRQVGGSMIGSIWRRKSQKEYYSLDRIISSIFTQRLIIGLMPE